MTMTEKADLPTDSVSLPPTYAPSETFTESPPPPYKRINVTAVRIARIVCFTLLALTFIVGFFVVTHKLIHERSATCDCPAKDSATSADRVQHAALFAEAPPKSDLNNNNIEELIKAKEADPKPEQLPVEEEEFENQVIEADEELKPEEQTKDEEMKEVNNGLQLPKDLLLGNPRLAGRNVQCKVQRNQRKIADGIMTQAIVVTCDDDDDDDDVDEEQELPQLPIVPIKPPMSLLSTIMKVLSSRPRSMDDRPQMGPQRLPFPFRPQEGPIPIIHPIRGPFPGPFQGPVNPIFVPLRKIEVRRPFPIVSDEDNGPPPFLRHLPQILEGRGPRMNDLPPQIRPFQPQEEENTPRLPFPFPGGQVPLRVIRLPFRPNDINEERPPFPQEEEEEEQGPLPPFPFQPQGRPIIRFIPNGRRIIRLMPKPGMENMPNEPLPFPIPRGALPLRHEEPEEPLMPHPMPEASGRALPAPVAIPKLHVVRLPLRPQEPQPFPEAKLITHMEVREGPEEEEETFGDHPIQILPPIAEENQNVNREFGPPKFHTVLESSPRPFQEEEPEDEFSQMDETFHQEPITQTQSQPRFLAPPPPNFAREGRTSFMAQLNPDAEVIPVNPENHPGPPPVPMQRIVLN